MTWNMDFGLASLFVLSVMLVYNIIRRDLPLRKNLAFNCLVISIAVADILDIMSSFAIEKQAHLPYWFIYTTIILFYAVLASIPFTISYLAVCLTDRMKQHSRKMVCLSFLILVPMEALILTSYFTNFCCEYTKERGYYTTTAGYVINVISALMLVVSCFYLHRHRSETQALSRRSLYAFTIITFLFAFAQILFFPFVPLICSGFTLSCLIMFIAVQNPDSYRDQRIGLFSRDGFNILQGEHFKERVKNSILCIAFSNYSVFRNSYGDDITQPFLKDIGEYLSREVCTKGVIPFYIHGGRFLLVKKGFYDFSKEKTVIDSRFLDPWEKNGLSFNFSPAYAYISSDLTISKMQEINFLIDRALEDAVKNGPFSFISVDEELSFETRHDLKIRQALDRALEEDSLEVWFQPIYAPNSDKISSAEALVRITDDELGVIYPDEFIKTAESNGSIIKLGFQVFRKICAFINTHDIKKYGLDYIEVNLSPIQCLNEHLADEIIAIRKAYGVSPDLINLEITETAASDASVVIENMLRLSRDGFSFSLDDYGTGYSNLMNMLSLPLSIIKIDKSIVWSYFDQSFALSVAAGGEAFSATAEFEPERDNNVLEDLIPMFQARGLKVLCEGVETNEMVRVLGEMGCDYMQGYFFSKPIPENDFLEYVKAKNRNRGIY